MAFVAGSSLVDLVQLNVVSIIQFFRDPRPMNCMVFDRLHPKPQLHNWQAAAIETAERNECETICRYSTVVIFMSTDHPSARS